LYSVEDVMAVGEALCPYLNLYEYKTVPGCPEHDDLLESRLERC
jgi:hypothetical protein